MNAARLRAPRTLRLNLSTRYQCLQRRRSSTSSPIPPPQPTFLKRNRSPLIWATLALLTGALGGQAVVHTLAPPPPPEQGTREDGILLADLNQRIDGHFKVKVLRGKCLGVSKQLKGEEGGWLEVVAAPVGLGGEGEGTRLVEGLQGAKGLGVERVFWDRREQKLVAVVWYGGALCGWPGVTHGGAIATTLAEKLSLAAALAEDKRSTDVLAAATPQRLPGTGNHAKMFAPATTPDEPAQLSLGYLKPTFANQFYIIRVNPAAPLEDKDKNTTGNVAPDEPYGGAEYEATLEMPDGKVCVKARARFAPTTTVQRLEKNAVEGVKQGYEQFRQWMWPSRQQSSQI